MTTLTVAGFETGQGTSGSKKGDLLNRKVAKDMRKVLTVIAGLATVLGLATLAPAASAEEEPQPYCQAGPDTNRFGAPHFMYEISMGATSRFDQNGVDYDIEGHGGIVGVLWNGGFRDTSMGDHLYLRYDDGGVTGEWGTNRNTPTDGARVSYVFGDGTGVTADVTTGKHGCEPEIEWTKGIVPPDEDPVVVKPVVEATGTQVKKSIRVRVTGTQPEGTVQTKHGTYYKVMKFNPRNDRTWQVGKGRVSGGDVDVQRVGFPRARKNWQVRVYSQGNLVSKSWYNPTKRHGWDRVR